LILSTKILCSKNNISFQLWNSEYNFFLHSNFRLILDYITPLISFEKMTDHFLNLGLPELRVDLRGPMAIIKDRRTRVEGILAKCSLVLYASLVVVNSRYSFMYLGTWAALWSWWLQLLIMVPACIGCISLANWSLCGSWIGCRCSTLHYFSRFLIYFLNPKHLLNLWIRCVFLALCYSLHNL